MPIVFETPGHIDIRAFTVFGLHAKPNTESPIGKFGSGLKNAIAVLLRHDIQVQLFIGETEYVFFKERTSFRGEEFQSIRMRMRKGLTSRWRSQELPYTTSFAKHWELWQAFREIESNTRDEGGTSWHHTDAMKTWPSSDKTTIVIDDPRFTEVYLDKDKVFLPNALTQRTTSQSLEIFKGLSHHVYWRGIRVYDLEVPTLYTYNILRNITLTEDRTMKYIFELHDTLAEYIARSQDKEYIDAVLNADSTRHYEGRVNFEYSYVAPSALFMETIKERKKKSLPIPATIATYYERHAPIPAETRTSVLQDELNYFVGSTKDLRLKRLLRHLQLCEIKEPTPFVRDEEPVDIVPDTIF